MRMVTCHTLFGEAKTVPAESLIQRASAYGLIFHDHHLLLARASHTQKYTLPGGGIEKGESNEEALIREVREETGIGIEVGAFIHFETDFFYYDPLNLAIHGFMFYYRCHPLDLVLPAIDYPADEGLDAALWVSLDALTHDSFQTHGPLTMELVRKNSGTSG
jgi:8-oxo-dGTP pyrophosphatase MutT (NUDIX family)